MISRDKLITEAENNNFFVDFINYLKYLEKQPIKMTATGNISISNIATLLDSFQHKEWSDFSYHLDIEYGLFKKKLVRIGCVEIEEIKNKNNITMISKFKVTPLGQLMFIKAQNSRI